MNTKVLTDAVNIAAVVLNGTMAGLLFAFSVAVMPALARQAPAAGAAAMQTANRAIVNPVFLVVFLGSALCALAAAVLAVTGGQRSWWTLVGGLVCFAGIFVVTVVFNIPLNNRLESIDVNSANGQEFWQQYLTQWTAWNHVRVVSGVLGTTLLAIGLVRR